MDHYYEMKNMLPQSHVYQPVENGHNADDRELKQVFEQAHRQRNPDQKHLKYLEIFGLNQISLPAFI
jgi:hypothetical protein